MVVVDFNITCTTFVSFRLPRYYKHAHTNNLIQNDNSLKYRIIIRNITRRISILSILKISILLSSNVTHSLMLNFVHMRILSYISPYVALIWVYVVFKNGHVTLRSYENCASIPLFPSILSASLYSVILRNENKYIFLSISQIRNIGRACSI